MRTVKRLKFLYKFFKYKKNFKLKTIAYKKVDFVANVIVVRHLQLQSQIKKLKIG